MVPATGYQRRAASYDPAARLKSFIVSSCGAHSIPESTQQWPSHRRLLSWVTDGELVEQVRAGNTDAFGELVTRHQGAIYRAALAALGNTADAEDVAQEAMVLAYRRLDQFRGDASVKTWMISIAWRLSVEPAATD